MKDTRICKICGKEYKACSPVYFNGVNRWQDVACCQEHGLEYFEQVEAARNPKPKANTKPEEDITPINQAEDYIPEPKRRKKKSAG